MKSPWDFPGAFYLWVPQAVFLRSSAFIRFCYTNQMRTAVCSLAIFAVSKAAGL